MYINIYDLKLIRNRTFQKNPGSYILPTLQKFSSSKIDTERKNFHNSSLLNTFQEEAKISQSINRYTVFKYLDCRMHKDTKVEV